MSLARRLLIASVVVAAGCTMCPDPYDYSGPVPNGSVTQNDFRARSNGIIPIGTLPRPWPPVVKRDEPAAKRNVAIAQALPASEATTIPEVVPDEPRGIAAAFESPAPEADNQ